MPDRSIRNRLGQIGGRLRTVVPLAVIAMLAAAMPLPCGAATDGMPGGVFLVIDHTAEAGSGMRDTDTLHRIDPAIVKVQVTSAGFVFDGESDVLRNPADDHKALVFDKSIRGHTDQFVFRFHKPV